MLSHDPTFALHNIHFDECVVLVNRFAKFMHVHVVKWGRILGNFPVYITIKTEYQFDVIAVSRSFGIGILMGMISIAGEVNVMNSNCGIRNIHLFFCKLHVEVITFTSPAMPMGVAMQN